ncbi:MAG TPA: HGxxPAAW family protein [Nocardioidaceae bacterium]|nr:HGxxPAAW family protein [Nocardioidaceae bacterium]
MSHHGNTPAAWTAVTLILAGFVVGGIGMIIENWTMFWVGVALLPVGAIVGKIMQKMGLGAAPLEDRASGHA